jgi:hypothetical protein
VYSAGEGACPAVEHLLLLAKVDTIVADAPSDQLSCGAFVLPALTKGSYFTGSGGIGSLSVGDSIVTSEVVYVYRPGAGSCSFVENSFEVTIVAPPVVETVLDQEACDVFVLPQLSKGSYYTGSGGTGNELAEKDSIFSTQEIYIYAVSELLEACSDEHGFEVRINATPVLDSFSEIKLLSTETYVLPSLSIGNYFALPNGEEALIVGDELTSSQVIYIYEEGEGSCLAVEEALRVTINTLPQIIGSPSTVVIEQGKTTTFNIYDYVEDEENNFLGDKIEIITSVNGAERLSYNYDGEITVVARSNAPIGGLEKLYVQVGDEEVTLIVGVPLTFVEPFQVWDGNESAGQGETILVDIEELTNAGEYSLIITSQPKGEGVDVYFDEELSELSIDLSNNKDFTGVDTVLYEVCVNELCKEGVFTFKIRDSLIVTEYLPTEIIAYNGLSPNGDGDNDFFDYQFRKGDDLFEYDNSRLQIFDRTGHIVYSNSSYNAQDEETRFVGKDQDSNEYLIDGQYYYLVKVNTGEFDEEFTGVILIKGSPASK